MLGAEIGWAASGLRACTGGVERWLLAVGLAAGAGTWLGRLVGGDAAVDVGRWELGGAGSVRCCPDAGVLVWCGGVVWLGVALMGAVENWIVNWKRQE